MKPCLVACLILIVSLILLYLIYRTWRVPVDLCAERWTDLYDFALFRFTPSRINQTDKTILTDGGGNYFMRHTLYHPVLAPPPPRFGFQSTCNGFAIIYTIGVSIVIVDKSQLLQFITLGRII